MARRVRIRRKLKRRAPAVRRSNASAAQMHTKSDAESQVLIGGAQDPAEKSADQLANKALGGSGASAIAVHRSAPATTVAPGKSSVKASASLSNTIKSLGSGQQLNLSERAFFEPRFGQDFSDVRVHEGTNANKANEKMDASAFSYGRDIALANGQRTRTTMAHELAHVALGHGKSAARRKIQTKEDPKLDISRDLSKTYKIGTFSKSGGLYEAATRTQKGGISTQIAQNMVQSALTFKLAGSTNKDLRANLAKHIAARQGVVDMAKTIQIDFRLSGAGPDGIRKGPLWFIHLEAKKKADKALADVTAAMPDMTEAQKTEYLDNVYNLHFKRMVREKADTKEMKEAAALVRSKSKDWTEGRDMSDDRPFWSACWMATATVVYGGGGSTQKQELGSYPSSVSIKASSWWNDWVPGDWGYIDNPVKTNDAAILGENIVYIGDGKFWAHYPGSLGSDTLEELVNEVSSWNSENSYFLSPTREYPQAGLE